MAVTLDKELFGLSTEDVQKAIPVMHQVVVAQQAAARQGTHKVKSRGEVSGGGKKPFRQKGTGRARQGSTRAPHMTGGGVVHGPTPRDYSQKTPKKLKFLALKAALSDRNNGGKVFVVDNFGIKGDQPSTKAAKEALKKICSNGEDTCKGCLVVVTRPVDNATQIAEIKSLRNISCVHLLYVDQLNTYDVLLNECVIFTQAAYDEFIKERKESK